MRDDAFSILLVEDDPTLADITAFRLELLGYEVVTAHSVQETQTHMISDLPDVVIIDLALNGGEGFDLLNRLSNDPRTTHVPVMIFSTNSDLDEVQRAYAAGAVEYLVTPFDPVNLEQKVEKLISQQHEVSH